MSALRRHLAVVPLLLGAVVSTSYPAMPLTPKGIDSVEIMCRRACPPQAGKSAPCGVLFSDLEPIGPSGQEPADRFACRWVSSPGGHCAVCLSDDSAFAS